MVIFLPFKNVLHILKRYQIICSQKIFVGTWKNYVPEIWPVLAHTLKKFSNPTLAYYYLRLVMMLV